MDVLVVAALEEEVAHVPPGVAVTVTGVGKARAAAGLAHRLATTPRPSLIVNIGTAGAVDGLVTGLVEVTWITQHDFPYEAIEQLIGERVARGYALGVGPPGVGPLGIGSVPRLQPEAPSGATALATGDVFVADAEHAASLSAQGIHLVDMEAYAFAAVCAEFDIPFRCVKVVSDTADSDAGASWLDTIDACARSLADWVTHELR